MPNKIEKDLMVKSAVNAQMEDRNLSIGEDDEDVFGKALYILESLHDLHLVVENGDVEALERILKRNSST